MLIKFSYNENILHCVIFLRQEIIFEEKTVKTVDI